MTFGLEVPYRIKDLTGMIVCKGTTELERMREANRLVSKTLDQLGTMVRPGVTTQQLDAAAEDLILRSGAKPAFKGYRGFPASVCASVNNQIVHGIPNDQPLREGEILSLDVGVYYKGFYGDSAWTFCVGEISPELRKLLDVTRESLYQGIEQVVVGNRISDISHGIQKYVEAYGFSVVREFVGHGIGRFLHEEPQVPNYGEPWKGPPVEAGHGLGHRAHGQQPGTRRQSVGRPVDGGDGGRGLQRPFRAFSRRDRNRPLDPQQLQRQDPPPDIRSGFGDCRG